MTAPKLKHLALTGLTCALLGGCIEIDAPSPRPEPAPMPDVLENEVVPDDECVAVGDISSAGC